jgi:hypothetical protein
MREAAGSYRDGRLPLDRLVWELKSRLSALHGAANQEWVDELRSAWWRLGEEVASPASRTRRSSG